MARLRYLSNARIGTKGTVCTGNMAITGDLDVSGSITYDTIDIPLSQNLQGTLTVGVDDTGFDVKFYGGSPNKYWLWDESADGVVLVGTTSHTGNLTMKGTSYIYFDDSGAAIQASTTNTLALTGTTISLNATTIALVGEVTSTKAITITPTTDGTFLDFVLETNWQHGTLINVDFAADDTAFDGDVVGINLDLGAEISATSEQAVTGLDINLPQMTADALTKALYGVLITAQGAFTLASSGTCTWDGVNITLPDITQSSGSLITCGLKITAGTVTSGTQYGVYVTGGNKLTGGVYAYIVNPTAGVDGVYAYMNVGSTVGWTAADVVAVRGYTLCDSSGQINCAYGGKFLLTFGSSYGTGNGLTAGLFVGVKNSLVGGASPSACAYFESDSDSSCALDITPMIVLACKGSGTKPNYAFEFGFAAGGHTVSTGSGTMYHEGTIKCKINGANMFIPFSTAEGTYTSAYPVVLTNATALGITSTITTEWTYPFFVKATFATNVSVHGHSAVYIRQNIAANTDISGTAFVNASVIILRVYGDDSSQTTLSSNGRFSAVAADYWTDDADIDVTGGIHSALSGHTMAGADYELTLPAEYCCIAAMDYANASATIPTIAYSGVYIAGYSNKNMGNAIKVHSHVTNFLEIIDDKAIASNTAVNPLTSVTSATSTGFIRVSVGGSTRYIALYNSTA